MSFPISAIEIFYYIEEFPDSTAEEIQKGIGLRLSTIKNKISLLTQNKIVVFEGKPRKYKISLNIAAETLAYFEGYQELAVKTRELRS